MRRSFRTHEGGHTETQGVALGSPLQGDSKCPNSRMSQRDIAYQPRATLWEPCPVPSRVLKERRPSPHGRRMHDPPGCGVPSERMNGGTPKPRALPWAGMRRPFRANPNIPTPENPNGISHQSPRLHAVGLAKAGYLGSSHPTTTTPTGLPGVWTFLQPYIFLCCIYVS
jgi:hypothetical protein